MNEEAKNLTSEHFKFSYEYDNHFLMNQQVKSANVAYKESFLLKTLIKDNGLYLKSIFYGWWCGREKKDCLQFQDVVIIKKLK